MTLFMNVNKSVSKCLFMNVNKSVNKCLFMTLFMFVSISINK